MDIKAAKISFQNKIPTEPLLKSAFGIHQFEDAKILNNSVGVMVSGHISFHTRAAKIAREILDKNPSLKDFIAKFKNCEKNKKLECVNSFVKEFGEYIDVVV